ncbi:hypothetical protein PVAP13_6KG362918 [Panicum virgatum]|uniref:Uncharacterized protein n=1 Tax=Panicum virgatum TaxID=38727 RepID=A0A8T0RG95_PANVG|nr:hypothetical protein PVAP13_6KG362918 [Panicum virgatum]
MPWEKNMVAMEAAVVTGILKVVGNKLAPLVIKEYRCVVSVKKDLQELQDLATQINSWLEAQGGRAEGNWLKKLKDVAYDVDDVVDEFQLEAEKKDVNSDGGTVSTYRTKPKSFLLQCTAAWKIKDIKKRFAEIVKQRADINAIKNNIPDAHPARHITVELLPLPNVDASSVIGRDREKHQIIFKLVESKHQQKIKIVSIIGLGGSGKTTLAKLVFNDGNIIAKDFEVRLWVHVSQEFAIQKLVEKLFEAFAENKSDHHPLPHMSKKISEKLSEKRFLLVLDDVWTEDPIQWEEFMAFLNGIAPGPGSTILLTTRSREVAVTVGSSDHFDLPLLSPNDSWQLFQQSIIMPATRWTLQFEEVGNQIVKKCGGLPLAIKVLACALTGKERIEEWKAMRDNSLLDAVGEENRLFACLKLSYFHLPSHLKPCFTICSLFPKGYMIDKEQLIDQWIAHDMVGVEVGVDYFEYTAHKYFNSLVQRSFLQDVDENSYGRVKCRMRDLVHDLAQSILGEKISLVVPKEASSSTRSYRYFSLAKQKIHLLPKNLFQKARALYADKCEVDCKIFSKALKNARHLRSVTMDCVDKELVQAVILQVKNLKYLEISRQYGEALPEAISDIWSLQTLHLTSSDLLELPKSIGKLQKLRTLNLSHCEKLKCLPDSIVNCQMISSIDLCNCKQLTVLPSSIGRNKMLRVLRLGNTKMERLPSSVTALRNLECLDLHDCRYLVEFPKDMGNLDKLHVLNLTKCKKLGGIPVGIRQLSGLQKLGLFALGKDEKFAGISELGNLPRIGGKLSIRGIYHGLYPVDAYNAHLKLMTNLQGLDLRWRMEDEVEVNTELEQAVLDCLEPPQGIKELMISGYSGRQYAWWMQNRVDGGELDIHGCPNLARHCERRKGEGWHLISHIPHLQIGQEKLDATSSFY